MDKYKVLLAGKNNLIIDDIFRMLANDFTIMSTSERYDDMNIHLDIFNPDIFICALNDETRDDISRFVELKRKLTKKEIAFAIIGDKDDCELFQKQSVYLADLIMVKPIDVNQIKNEITDHLDEIRKQREENKRIEEALLAIREEERRKHVLVIDDDPLMLKLIKEYLHESYDVATAISGKIAYKFLETKKTDLILIDYAMPGEDGAAVLTKLRENEELANIPAIFLTGVTDKEMIKKVLVMKPQGYLLKPVDREKLLGTIEKFIG